MSDRLELLHTVREWPVLITFMPIEPIGEMYGLGYWHETWTHHAGATIIDRLKAGRELSEYIKAEGDALYGHGGRVHIRLDGEREYPRE